MIFEEVVLHNFGAYRGEHHVELGVDAGHPVVLIGAMNGSGKTTFLDAMQLALYGKSARCTGRERVSYPDYLTSMINRDTLPCQGACVEFAFRTRVSGQDSRIRIKRNWFIKNQMVKENLEVERDGVLDAVASERWQEFVEDFMPSQIADLFFFDGEKIEALADPTRSAALLRVGVHSLLGIDLVESLIKSLQQVERKRKVSGSKEADRQKLEQLFCLRTELQAHLLSKKEKLASLRTESDALNARFEVAQEEFRRIGGDLYDRHEQLVKDKASLQRRQVETVTALLEYAAGVLPLAVATKALERTVKLATHQRSAADNVSLKQLLQGRDEELIQFLASSKAGASLIKLVTQYLLEERNSRVANPVGLIAYPEGVAEQYRPDHIQEAQTRVVSFLAELERIKEALVTIEGHLAAVPDEATISSAQEKLESLRDERVRSEVQIEMAEEDIRESQRKLETINADIERESDLLHDELMEHESSERVISHSVLARKTLSMFKDRLLENNLERLQTTIRTCFRQLLRKQTLVSSIRINPDSFEMSVVHPSGQVVPAHRLSAGERQLLAVATLWALSQASGRHLPAVIDTPLSRLDSRHRETVVRNYFPQASHQVILLSTDEEVVGRYYKMLKRHIGRQSLIVHDEHANTSSFMTGQYFEIQETQKVIAA